MQTKVFTAMAIVALLLGGYTLKLHEHLLPASEEQAHHACRQICRIGLLQVSGVQDHGPLASVTSMIAASACDALDDNLQVLKDCRDRMSARGLTVATWRCLAAAGSMSQARACDQGLF